MEELQDILEGCRRGDARWQHRLYEAYSSRFYAFCLRYAPNETEAEDMLVEGFTKIFLSLDSFRGDGSFLNWMYRIFTSVAISHYRKNSHSHEVPLQENANEISEDGDTTAAIDLQHAMREALQQLPDKYRVVFNMVAIEGYSVAEVASTLPLPKSTARHYYNVAKEMMACKLRHLMGDKYWNK